jgi:hypothetical protein
MMQRKIGLYARLGLIATFGALGCREPTAIPPTRGDILPLPATTRVTGRGATLPPNERLEFDFNVNDAPGGRMLVIWYASYPPPMGVERLTVDPADPATQILSFKRTSPKCVQFSGTGRLDITAEIKVFFVDVCDNASPGVGFDTFAIDIPSDRWQRLQTLSEGDIVIGPF